MGQGVKLTCYLSLVPRSGMRGAVSLIPYPFLWRRTSLPSGETLPLPLLRPIVDGKMCNLKPITRYKNQSSLVEGLQLGVHTLRFPTIQTDPFDSAGDATPFLGCELWVCSADSEMYGMYKIFKRSNWCPGFLNSVSCFDHSCDHQGNENKKTNTIVICRNHSKKIWFLVEIRGLSSKISMLLFVPSKILYIWLMLGTGNVLNTYLRASISPLENPCSTGWDA